MKLLFLDIDGVLNSMGYVIGYDKPFLNADYIGTTGANLDPECVAILQKFVTENDFKIVLSSTWRLHGQDFDTWKAGMEYHFNWPDFPIIGQTPSLTDERRYEIEDFMKGKEVEDFVILDDDSDAWIKRDKHFYQTNMGSGLTKEIFFWWTLRNSPAMFAAHGFEGQIK